MSLGKLLTTGKSLVGLHDTNARYQLRKGVLPKFESSKNPFASRPRGESVPPSAEREPQLPKLTPAEVAAANLKKTQSLPALNQQAGEPAQSSEPAAPVKATVATDGWVKKLNPLAWWGNRKPAQAKPAAVRSNKVPVQGELSLDNIKVMRNDLSEADVEMVPVKTRPASMPSAPAHASATATAVPDLPPATNAWEYIGERLLGKH